MQIKVLSILSILVIGLTCLTNAGWANDVDIDAFLIVRKVISIEKTSDMNFGIVEHGQSPEGFINLGTDGTLSLDNASDIAIKSSGNAAQISIAGDERSVVDISCESGGTLNNGSGQEIELSSAEISLSAGAFGSGVACSGVENSIISNSFNTEPNPKIHMGAQIDMTGVTTSGNYSTLNAGGNPVTIRVLYQ